LDLQLKNKIVVVTGCNGGIGSAIVQSFLKEGALVVGVYRNSLSKLDELFNWINLAEIPLNNFIPIEMDIDSTPSIQQGLGVVLKKWNRIDVLINNAGATIETPFLALEDNDIDIIYSSNFSSLAKLSREVGKIMLRQKNGNIVNISSAVSDRFGRGVSVYASMKAAVNRLTEVMALELGKKNIRVNAVCPGVVETPMSNALQDRHSVILLNNTPLRRFATPSEIAMSVLFLASDVTASFITGTQIFVDGGIRL